MLPRYEICGALFSSTYATTIGFWTPNALLMASFISAESFSSVSTGGALMAVLLIYFYFFGAAASGMGISAGASRRKNFHTPFSRMNLSS